MSLNTEQLRDRLEGEFPIDIAGIYINRKGVRVQYREQYGDEGVDRKLRKTQITESVDAFIKKSAYMDASLDRSSRMMMQLESGNVPISIQRVANKNTKTTLEEYRVRQDIVRNTEEQYIFSTKYYSLNNKESAENIAQTLREHVCSENEKKFVLELQHLSTSNEYSSFARFHTNVSYSSILGIQTLA